MIRLKIEEYCQECPEFEPIKKIFYANNQACEIIIRCEHEKMCKEIAKHIERTQKKWI